MRIGGLHKTTLLDFPGRVSALIFTQGCNFHCPYCHNPQLARGEGADLPLTDVLAFLARRRNVLQGVVISGGEPTLQPGLAAFCAAVRDMGYAVKLDTNGSRPDVLEALLRQDLLDYVALDVKAPLSAYPDALCSRAVAAALPRSVELLAASRVPHEYRVTCVRPFVTEQNFSALLEALRPDVPCYLQKARLDGPVLMPEFFPTSGQALTAGEVDALASIGTAHGCRCAARGA